MSHLASPSTSTTPGLANLVQAYDSELSARRAQLLDDLAEYQHRIDDLKALDPQDFTGLQNLYRAHVGQINLLLSEFDDAGTPPPPASAMLP